MDFSDTKSNSALGAMPPFASNTSSPGSPGSPPTDGRGTADGETFRDRVAHHREAARGDGTAMLAAAGNAKAASEDENPVLARIRELGFQAYAKEVHEENLEKLREKILKSMGLTEDDLAKMTPDQREAVEKIVENEIMRRLMSQAELNGQSNRKTTVMAGGSLNLQGAQDGIQAQTVSNAQPSQAAAPMGAGQSGLGVLLALQAIDQAKVQAKAQADGHYASETKSAGAVGNDPAGHPLGKNDRPVPRTG